MISVFDLFKIGIGPSPSHTVGPMRAAAIFLDSLRVAGRFGDVRGMKCVLYGSLAWTGEGHATDKAIVLVARRSEIAVKPQAPSISARHKGH